MAIDKDLAILKHTWISAALLAAGLAGSPPASSQDFTLPIKPNDGWHMSTITFHGAGQIALIFKPVAWQGRVGLCGVAVPDGNAVVRLTHATIQDTRFMLGSKQLIPNADHFPVLKPTIAKDIIGTQAGCTLTRVPASPDLLRQPMKAELRKGYVQD